MQHRLAGCTLGRRCIRVMCFGEQPRADNDVTAKEILTSLIQTIN